MDNNLHESLKKKEQLQPIIDRIASDASPVGMDAVYVHALILEKLMQLEKRLEVIERTLHNPHEDVGQKK